MNKRVVLPILTGVIALGIVSLRMNLNDSGRPQTVQNSAQPLVNSAYQRCFDERDKAMHREVFANVDNPDVQREMISTNRDKIRADCRREFPD